MKPKEIHKALVGSNWIPLEVAQYNNNLPITAKQTIYPHRVLAIFLNKLGIKATY